MLTSLCANLGPVCCAARRGPQRLRVVSAAAGDEQPPSLGLGAPAGSSLLSVSPATSSTAAWVRSAVALDAARVTSPPEYVFRLPSRQPARWSLQSLRVFVARHPLLFFHTKFSKRRDRERCDYGLSCSYPRPDASVEETHGKQRALLRLLDLFEASDPTIDCTWRQLDILASIACYIPESSWRAVLPKDVCADDEPSLMALPIHVLRQRKVVRIGAALLGVRHDDAADLFAEWESPIDRSHEPSQRALVTVSFAESSGQSVRSALKAAFPTLTITDKAVRFLQEDVKWRRKRLRRLCKDATPWFIDYASFFGGLRIAQAAGVVGLSVNSNELLFAAVLAMHLLPLLPLDAAEEAFWMDAVGLIARLRQDSGDSTLAQELAFLTSNAGNNVVPKGYLTSLPLAEVGCLLANTLRECGGNTVEAAKKCMDGRTAKTLGKQARVHCRQLTAEDTASSLWRVPFEQRSHSTLVLRWTGVMVDEGGREITGEWEAAHLDTLAARRAHGQQQDNCLARMDATGEVWSLTFRNCLNTRAPLCLSVERCDDGKGEKRVTQVYKRANEPVEQRLWDKVRAGWTKALGEDIKMTPRGTWGLNRHA